MQFSGDLIPSSCCFSLTQVKANASSLNTNDVFVLKTPTSLFVWKGKGASSDEIAAAESVAKFLGGSVTKVEETKEPGKTQNKLLITSGR